jgi:hypothetical protein
MFDKDTLEEARHELCEPMADGGLPRYLTEDIESDEWEHYGSRVTYEIPGTMAWDVDDEDLPRRGGEGGTINSDEEVTLDFTEKLKASIINVEAWLHDHWLETIELSEEFQMGDGKWFLADLRKAKVAIDFDKTELVKAARQRAMEDSTHFLYVLGNWTYLAEKNDHVKDRTGHKLHRIFERAKQNSPNPPGDATCDEHGGGRYDN